MHFVWLFMLFLTTARAQLNDVKKLEKIGQALARATIDQCLSNENCTSISGQNLALALSHDKTTCSKDEKTESSPIISDSDEKQREVLFAVEIHVNPTQRGSIETHHYVFDESGSRLVDSTLPNNAQSDWNEIKKWTESFNTSNASIRRSLFVEGLVSVGAQSKLSENELAQKLAAAITNYSADDQEKMAILSTLSSRLYRNYNDLRNPYQNHSGIKDTRNLHLDQMLLAAAEWKTTDGGVCNDIAQSVATLSKKLFPGKSSLVFNNGSHFGVVIKEKGKDPSFITWGLETSKRSQLTFSPEVQVTATRIYDVTPQGVLKQIANLDTELGAAFKKMYSETTPILRTGADPNLITLQDKTTQNYSDGKQKTKTQKVGIAQTEESLMLIFMGETLIKKRNTTSSQALGVALQQVNPSGQQDVVIAFHKTFDQRIVKYKNPRVSVELNAGAQIDASYTQVTKTIDPTYNQVTLISKTFETYEKLKAQTNPSHSGAASFSGDVTLTEVLGRANEGVQTGLESTPLKGTLEALQYTNFFMNQIDANAALRIPLLSRVHSITQSQYQGSPVGQKISIDTGIEIRSKGSFDQVYVLVGFVNSDLKGFRGEQNLLRNPSGARVLGGVNLKNGVRGGVRLEGLGTPESRGNFTIDASLFKRRKAH